MVAKVDARVSVVMDNVRKTFESLREITGKQVLVGIPSDREERKGDEDEDINNAALGYIHEFGSPAANIPARPFLIPGVRDAEKSELYQLRKAARAALEGETKLAMQAMNAAGIVASNSARNKISSNIPPPLQPETIARRHIARGTKSMRESEQVYLRLIAQGVDPGAAQNEVGIISLINTGQLRNSITYVIRQK